MFYLGLDLGQRVDHTALALVQKIERWRPYGEPEFEALHVRYVERMPLGTPYPAVVEYVRRVLSHAELWKQTQLVVDATGLGAPVVEMLRQAGLECQMWAVTITSGEKETQGAYGSWNVPKRDLIAGLQVLMEQDQLHVAKDLPEVGALVRELMDVRVTAREGGRSRVGADGRGQHDDLVMALALACWRGRKLVKKIGLGGGRILRM